MTFSADATDDRTGSVTPLPGHQAPEKVERGEDTIALDLGEVLRTLWRGKFRILLVMVLMVAGAIYYANFMTTPTYRAATVIILETNEPQLVDFEGVVSSLTGENDDVSTEIEVLRSRNLLATVVDDLDLTTYAEFNPALREPGLRARVRGQIRTWYYQLLGQAEPPLPDLSLERQHELSVTNLQSALEVRNISSSLAFSIGIETTDRRLSATVVDTLAQAYIDDQLEVKASATITATNWLAERVADLEEEVSVSTQAVQDFRTNTDLVSPEALAAIERQMKDVRARVDDLTGDLATQQARQAALEEAAGSGRIAQAAVANDANLDDLLLRIDSGDSTAQTAFDRAYRQMLSRATLTASRTAAQLAALSRSQETLSAQIETQSQDLITLDQLEREANATSVLYNYFLTRLNETSVQQGIQRPDSRIISNAVVPTEPSSPRKTLIVAAAGLMGLLLGFLWVMVRESRATGFRTADDLSSFAGYPVLGQVPRIVRLKRKKLLSFLDNDGTSAAAEAIRNLRTSLLLVSGVTPPKLIMVTSTVPGEGKTTQAISLAHNLAALGHKVLLIEGDTRRGTFAEYFKATGKGDLFTAIEGQQDVADIVVSDSEIKADILMGRSSAANAADVYQSKNFARFIKDIKDSYDHIIVDTPPVLAVSDARIIARFADFILYVVHWDKTSRELVNAGLSEFEVGGLQVDGFVLSQIDPKGMKRYGYGVEYGNYYGPAAKR